MNISVTGLLKDFHAFDRDFWLSYKAMESVCDPNIWNMLKIKLLKSKRIDAKVLSNVDMNEYLKKREEIDALWTKQSDEAKAAGIAMHEKLHNMLVTNLPDCKRDFGIPTDKYKVEKLENFMNSDGLFPEFKMEVKLNDEITLVGIADLIVKSGNIIEIYDYKTNDKITQHGRYEMSKKKKKTLNYPLSHLEDCDMTIFKLQLSLYAWMLKRLNPDFIINGLHIINYKQGAYKKMFDVEYAEKDIDTLIKWYLKQYVLKQKTLACREKRYV